QTPFQERGSPFRAIGDRRGSRILRRLVSFATLAQREPENGQHPGGKERHNDHRRSRIASQRVGWTLRRTGPDAEHYHITDAKEDARYCSLLRRNVGNFLCLNAPTRETTR